MLPFLKNREEGAGQGPSNPIERKHDDTYDMLDAVVEDLFRAFETKDKALAKEALQSLCDHIQSLDTKQDQQTMGES
jgi:hypothetical protein